MQCNRIRLTLFRFLSLQIAIKVCMLSSMNVGREKKYERRFIITTAKNERNQKKTVEFINKCQ